MMVAADRLKRVFTPKSAIVAIFLLLLSFLAVSVLAYPSESMLFVDTFNYTQAWYGTGPATNMSYQDPAPFSPYVGLKWTLGSATQWGASVAVDGGKLQLNSAACTSGCTANAHITNGTYSTDLLVVRWRQKFYNTSSWGTMTSTVNWNNGAQQRLVVGGLRKCSVAVGDNQSAGYATVGTEQTAGVFTNTNYGVLGLLHVIDGEEYNFEIQYNGSSDQCRIIVGGNFLNSTSARHFMVSDTGWYSALSSSESPSMTGMRFRGQNAAAVGYTEIDDVQMFTKTGRPLDPRMMIYEDFNDKLEGNAMGYTLSREQIPGVVGWQASEITASVIPQGMTWIPGIEKFLSTTTRVSGVTEALLEIAGVNVTADGKLAVTDDGIFTLSGNNLFKTQFGFSGTYWPSGSTYTAGYGDNVYAHYKVTLPSNIESYPLQNTGSPSAGNVQIRSRWANGTMSTCSAAVNNNGTASFWQGRAVATVTMPLRAKNSGTYDVWIMMERANGCKVIVSGPSTDGNNYTIATNWFTTTTATSNYGHGLNFIITDQRGNSTNGAAGGVAVYDDIYVTYDAPITALSKFPGVRTNILGQPMASALNQPAIENSSAALIQWTGSNLNFSGANFDTYVTMLPNFVSVDSANLPAAVNTSANVTLYGDYSTWTNPVIKKDGVTCADCTLFAYNASGAYFNVSGFSNYTLENGTVGNADINLTACGLVLNDSTDLTVNLENDMEVGGTAYGTCIEVLGNAVNLTVDCKGHEVNVTGADWAFMEFMGSIDGLTVRNCIMRDYVGGMFINQGYTGGSNVTGTILIENVTANPSGDGFVWLNTGADGVYLNNPITIIRDSHINITGAASYLFGAGNAGAVDQITVKVYNNIITLPDTINNFFNLQRVDATVDLNTTSIASTNIVGGSTSGGNYWTNPSGTGFSDICTNAGDFCDTSYNVSAYVYLATATLSGGIDYLPLMFPLPDAGRYYSFDDTFNDSWSGRNGNNTGVTFSTDTPTIGNGTVLSGKSAQFAASPDYVDIPVLPISVYGQGATVSFWVKSPVDNINSGEVYFDSTDGSATSGWVSINEDTGGAGSTYAFTEGSNTVSFVNPVVLDDVWHHIVVTQNSSDSLIYMDGVVVASNPNGYTAGTLIDSTASFARIGADVLGNNNAGGSMPAFIDELKVYNYSLSASEVTSLYQCNNESAGCVPQYVSNYSLARDLNYIWYDDFNRGDGAISRSNNLTRNSTSGDLWRVARDNASYVPNYTAEILSGMLKFTSDASYDATSFVTEELGTADASGASHVPLNPSQYSSTGTYEDDAIFYNSSSWGTASGNFNRNYMLHAGFKDGYRCRFQAYTDSGGPGILGFSATTTIRTSTGTGGGASSSYIVDGNTYHFMIQYNATANQCRLRVNGTFTTGYQVFDTNWVSAGTTTFPSDDYITSFVTNVTNAGFYTFYDNFKIYGGLVDPEIKYATYDGVTSDFLNNATFSNWSALPQPVLEKSSYGRVQWAGGALNFRAADFDTYGYFQPNLVGLDSANLPTDVNTAANVTIYGDYSTWIGARVMKDGVECTECTLFAYNSTGAYFNVSGFSNYTIENNTIVGSSIYGCGNLTAGTDYVLMNDIVVGVGQTCFVMPDVAGDISIDGMGKTITAHNDSIIMQSCAGGDFGCTLSAGGMRLFNVSVVAYDLPVYPDALFDFASAASISFEDVNVTFSDQAAENNGRVVVLGDGGTIYVNMTRVRFNGSDALYAYILSDSPDYAFTRELRIVDSVFDCRVSRSCSSQDMGVGGSIYVSGSQFYMENPYSGAWGMFRTTNAPGQTFDFRNNTVVGDIGYLLYAGGQGYQFMNVVGNYIDGRGGWMQVEGQDNGASSFSFVNNTFFNITGIGHETTIGGLTYEGNLFDSSCIVYTGIGSTPYTFTDNTFTCISGFDTVVSYGGGTLTLNRPALKNQYGLLKWLGSGLNFNTGVFSSYVVQSDNYVSVDSANLPTDANTSANVTLYGDYSTWENPTILKDGVACGASCTNVVINSTGAYFTVTGFSNYSVSNLTTTLTLISPANNTELTSVSTYFTFNLTGGNGSESCTLFIDGLSQSNLTVSDGQWLVNASSYLIANNYDGSTHNWSVTCGSLNSTVLYFTVKDPAYPYIVESCRVLQSGGAYVLTQNLTYPYPLYTGFYANQGLCVYVNTSQPASIDCRGNTLTGVGNSSTSWGIFSPSGSPLNVSNCVMSGHRYVGNDLAGGDLYLDSGGSSTRSYVSNNTFRSRTTMSGSCNVLYMTAFNNSFNPETYSASNGLYFRAAYTHGSVQFIGNVFNVSQVGSPGCPGGNYYLLENNTFVNTNQLQWAYESNSGNVTYIGNHFRNVLFYGGFSSTTAPDQTFVNNIMNNTLFGEVENPSNGAEVFLNGSVFNQTNIVGRSQWGGNYWTNSTGGFSDTCLNQNNDSFCDSSYYIYNPYGSGSNGTDYYPLTLNGPIPIITQLSPLNRSVFTDTAEVGTPADKGWFAEESYRQVSYVHNNFAPYTVSYTAGHDVNKIELSAYAAATLYQPPVAYPATLNYTLYWLHTPGPGNTYRSTMGFGNARLDRMQDGNTGGGTGGSDYANYCLTFGTHSCAPLSLMDVNGVWVNVSITYLNSTAVVVKINDTVVGSNPETIAPQQLNEILPFFESGYNQGYFIDDVVVSPVRQRFSNVSSNTFSVNLSGGVGSGICGLYIDGLMRNFSTNVSDGTYNYTVDGAVLLNKNDDGAEHLWSLQCPTLNSTSVAFDVLDPTWVLTSAHFATDKSVYWVPNDTVVVSVNLSRSNKAPTVNVSYWNGTKTGSLDWATAGAGTYVNSSLATVQSNEYCTFSAGNCAGAAGSDGYNGIGVSFVAPLPLLRRVDAVQSVVSTSYKIYAGRQISGSIVAENLTLGTDWNVSLIPGNEYTLYTYDGGTVRATGNGGAISTVSWKNGSNAPASFPTLRFTFLNTSFANTTFSGINKTYNASFLVQANSSQFNRRASTGQRSMWPSSMALLDAITMSYMTAPLIDTCYQEYANVTSCGASGPGTWSYDTNNVYINYTKPSGAIYAVSQVMGGFTGFVPVNYTLPLACLNADPNVVQMKFFANKPGGIPWMEARWSCYNGTGWTQLVYASNTPTGANFGAALNNFANMFDGNYGTAICYHAIGAGGWASVGSNPQNCLGAEPTFFYEEAMYWGTLPVKRFPFNVSWSQSVNGVGTTSYDAEISLNGGSYQSFGGLAIVNGTLYSTLDPLMLLSPANATFRVRSRDAYVTTPYNVGAGLVASGALIIPTDVVLVSPANGTQASSVNQLFTFNTTGISGTCSLYLDGVSQNSTAVSSDGQYSLTAPAFLIANNYDGYTHNWSIQCTQDNSTTWQWTVRDVAYDYQVDFCARTGDQPGRYVVSQNLTCNGGAWGSTVSNTELDCRGYTLSTSGAGNDVGGLSGSRSNQTVRNCKFQMSGNQYVFVSNGVDSRLINNSWLGSASYEIRATSASNIYVEDNYFQYTTGKSWGFYLDSASSYFSTFDRNVWNMTTPVMGTNRYVNQMRNNTFYAPMLAKGSQTNGAYSGNRFYSGAYLYIDDGVTYPATVYDNFFNTTVGYFIYAATAPAKLNTTQQAGTNIIGGSYLGGNYYGWTNGTGYSDMCFDYMRDGICDASYDASGSFAISSYDYLPLTQYRACYGNESLLSPANGTVFTQMLNNVSLQATVGTYDHVYVWRNDSVTAEFNSSYNMSQNYGSMEQKAQSFVAQGDVIVSVFLTEDSSFPNCNSFPSLCLNYEIREGDGLTGNVVGSGTLTSAVYDGYTYHVLPDPVKVIPGEYYTFVVLRPFNYNQINYQTGVDKFPGNGYRYTGGNWVLQAQDYMFDVKYVNVTSYVFDTNASQNASVDLTEGNNTYFFATSDVSGCSVSTVQYDYVLARPVCGANISACCVITSSGTYDVVADINETVPASDFCIYIRTDGNVTIDGNGNTVAVGGGAGITNAGYQNNVTVSGLSLECLDIDNGASQGGCIALQNGGVMSFQDVHILNPTTGFSVATYGFKFDGSNEFTVLMDGGSFYGRQWIYTYAPSMTTYDVRNYVSNLSGNSAYYMFDGSLDMFMYMENFSHYKYDGYPSDYGYYADVPTFVVNNSYFDSGAAWGNMIGSTGGDGYWFYNSTLKNQTMADGYGAPFVNFIESDFEGQLTSQFMATGLRLNATRSVFSLNALNQLLTWDQFVDNTVYISNAATVGVYNFFGGENFTQNKVYLNGSAFTYYALSGVMDENYWFGVNETTGWSGNCTNDGTGHCLEKPYDIFGDASLFDNAPLTFNEVPTAVTLLSPANSSVVSTIAENFTFNVYFALNETCNLTIDGVVRNSTAANVDGNYSLGASSYLYSINGDGLSHNWSVQCTHASSDVWNFTVVDASVFEMNVPACPVLTYPNANNQPSMAVIPVNFSLFRPVGFSSPALNVSLSFGAYEASVSESSCSYVQSGAQYRNYTCNVSMQFYYPYGDWDLSVVAVDDGYNVSSLQLAECGFGKLVAYERSTGTVLFPSAQPDVDDAQGDQPIVVLNTGNSPLALFMTGYDLVGNVNPGATLSAMHFKVGQNLTAAAIMQNGVQKNLSTVVPAGFNSTATVYMWLSIPAGQMIQDYVPSQQWSLVGQEI